MSRLRSEIRPRPVAAQLSTCLLGLRGALGDRSEQNVVRCSRRYGRRNIKLRRFGIHWGDHVGRNVGHLVSNLYCLSFSDWYGVAAKIPSEETRPSRFPTRTLSETTPLTAPAFRVCDRRPRPPDGRASFLAPRTQIGRRFGECSRPY